MKNIDIYIKEEDYNTIVNEDIMFVTLGDIKFIRKTKCEELMLTFHKNQTIIEEDQEFNKSLKLMRDTIKHNQDRNR